MASNKAGAGIKTQVKMNNDDFLSKCIKHAKEKLNVNWATFAADTGMSADGAR
jgi:hypothetical protein